MVEGITNVVAEELFGVPTNKEVVTIGIEGAVAVSAGMLGHRWWKDGKTELALIQNRENGSREAVVGVTSIVGG